MKNFDLSSQSGLTCRDQCISSLQYAYCDSLLQKVVLKPFHRLQNRSLRNLTGTQLNNSPYNSDQDIFQRTNLHQTPAEKSQHGCIPGL